MTVSVSQEEEDGSDEDSMSSMPVDELPVPPPLRATRPAAGEEDSDRDSDPAFVSPLDEVKAVRQQPPLTTANLHEASRSVWECDGGDRGPPEHLKLWKEQTMSLNSVQKVNWLNKV